jgi:hypothetical protein
VPSLFVVDGSIEGDRIHGFRRGQFVHFPRLRTGLFLLAHTVICVGRNRLQEISLGGVRMEDSCLVAGTTAG